MKVCSEMFPLLFRKRKRKVGWNEDETNEKGRKEEKSLVYFPSSKERGGHEDVFGSANYLTYGRCF